MKHTTGDKNTKASNLNVGCGCCTLDFKGDDHGSMKGVTRMTNGSSNPKPFVQRAGTDPVT